jgi:hypothetical protein
LDICTQAGHVGVESITKDGNPFFVAEKSAACAEQAENNITNPTITEKIFFIKLPSFLLLIDTIKPCFSPALQYHFYIDATIA